MNRREFLKHGNTFILGASALSGLASLFPGGVLAASGARKDDSLPHLFLIVRVRGGMDSTLGLNPWLGQRPDPADLYLDRDYEVLASVGATEIALGPSALPLRPHVGDIAVVGGVFMGPNDLGHSAAENYMATAKAKPNAPHFIAELAECYRQYRLDKREAVLFNGSLNTFDLTQLARLPIQPLLESGAEEGIGGGIPRLTALNSAFAKAHSTLLKFSGSETKRRLETLLDDLRLSHDELLAEHAVVASFAADHARFGQIDWDYFELDAHENFIGTHQRVQRIVWGRLASLIDLMKNTAYLDTQIPLFPNLVTLLVTTEFSRLPFLNGSDGKDHNYFDNSVLLGGRGIKGGRLLGGHHLFVRDGRRRQSQLSGCHIDYGSGRVVKNGYYNTQHIDAVSEGGRVALIRPENILRSLGEVFGVDYEFMRLFSRDTLVLPRIL